MSSRSFRSHLALLGDPITHSLSPLIQNAALQELEIACDYEAIEVKSVDLPSRLSKLSKKNFIGFNLTLPHKQIALSYVDKISEHAHLLGAINTIVIRNEKSYGYNTDGPGFIKALQENGNCSLAHQRILILGASGGAGRALAAQCLLEGCSELYLVGRSHEKLGLLKNHLKAIPQKTNTFIQAISLEISSLAKIMPEVDFIVNATPVGMQQEDLSLIPSTLFHPKQFVFDTIYSPNTTPLMEAALEAGASAFNGLSMLLHQAALAFQLWFPGTEPLEIMRKALLKK